MLLQQGAHPFVYASFSAPTGHAFQLGHIGKQMHAFHLAHARWIDLDAQRLA